MKLDYNKINRVSKQIIEHFNTNCLICNAIFELYQAEKLVLDNENINSHIEKISEKLMTELKSIDCNWALPILLQVTEDYYYNNKSISNNLGLISKYLVTLFWNKNTSSNQSIDKLILIYEYAFLLFAVAGYQSAFDYTEINSITLQLEYPNIIDPEIEKSLYFKLLQATYSYKGKGLRVLDIVNKIIWSREFNSIVDVVNVVKGNKSEHEVFKDTFLNSIPISNKDFWLPLVNMLMLLVIAKAIQPLLNPNGVVLLDKKQLNTNFELNLENLANIDSLSWNQVWYSELNKQNLHFKANGIIKKPLLTIKQTDANVYYITTPMIIGDAINNYIESCFMDMQNKKRLNLEQQFKDYISTPFENEVINSYRENGFIAGSISKKGFWQNDKDDFKKGVVLKDMQQNLKKGEIDCLAINHDKKIIIVNECKVLEIPRNQSRLKTVIDNLYSVFPTKLKDRLNWLSNTEQISTLNDYTMFGIIVTDRYMPNIDLINKNKKIAIMPLEQLFKEI